MSALVFSFAEFLQEIEAIAKLSQRFTRADSWGVLDELKTSLRNIQGAGSNHMVRWGIPESRPLRTTTHHAGTAHRLFGELTSVWEIQPHPARPNKYFSLVGIASTRIRVYDEKDDQGHAELAMWRMEVADDNSPGCYFHVQVLGELDHVPFPHSLPVPRLPTFMTTPMFAFEYVLGEIFQDQWKQEVARDNDNVRRWRGIQAKRFENLFHWQGEMIRPDFPHALGS